MTEPSFEPNFYRPPSAPLAYAGPPVSRPGLITAMGICSIIIGSLGVLANLCGGLQSAMYLVMANVPLPVTTTSKVITTGGATSGPTTNGAVYSTYAVASSPPTTAPITTTTALSPFQVSPAASVLNLIGEALSLGAAIYILIAGTAILRDKPGAGRMHWRYVWLKIPVALIASIGVGWTSHDMLQSMSATPSGGVFLPFAGQGATWMAFFQAGFSAGLSLIYPIALLIVLSTRQVKAYFNGARADSR